MVVIRHPFGDLYKLRIGSCMFDVNPTTRPSFSSNPKYGAALG